MDKRQQIDMFVADILDVSPKGDLNTMENPVFSLSTKPDTEMWNYENGDTFIRVTPSTAGRPTIFDKDLLMYCISQVVEGMNRNRPISRRVKITAYDYLTATGRGTGGRAYDLMLESMERLRGVTITTNIGTKRRAGQVRGLIDNAEVIEKDDKGRMVHIEIDLSEWIFNAITDKQVLTYNPKYYSLRKPHDRRMYELCRKFCGTQPVWEIGFEKLYNRFGTRAKPKEFRRSLREMIELQNIPDYELFFDNDRSVLMVYYMPDAKKKAATERQDTENV